MPDWTLLWVVFFGLVVSGVVKGVTGIGYASCALPFLVFAIGLKQAIVVALVPAMATNVMLALSGGQLEGLLKRFSALYLAMLPGIVVGSWGLSVVDSGLASAFLGIAIMLYAFFSLLRSNISLEVPESSKLQSFVGFFSGIVAGFTGSQVIPLIPFLMASNLKPAQLAQSINLGVTILSVVVLLSMLTLRTVSATLILASTLAIPPAIFGVWLGVQLRPHLPDAWFRIVLLIVLAFSGLGLITRQLI